MMTIIGLRLASYRSASPPRPASRLGVLAGPITWALLALVLGSGTALATNVTVPDDFATVQQGINSGADTVLVREGTYSEVPVADQSLVLIGIGTKQRPRLNGLTLSNLVAQRTTVIGFDFTNTVVYSNAANKSPITVTLSDCSMDNGIQVNADDPDAHCSLVLNRCRMRYVNAALDDIHMEADTLDGAVTVKPWSNPVVIQHCWFRGGAGAAITLSHEPYSTYVAHNRIENYTVSISAPEAGLTMDGNTISGCGTGIEVGREGYIWNNVVRDCEIGIHCNGGSLQLFNNTILNASGDGISIQYPDGLQVHGNIVGYCGGNGIVLDAYYQPYEVDIRNNTIFNNHGSGILWSAQPYSATVRGNIGYGNAGWGLTTQPGGFISLGCNDWFGNGSGATNGVAVDSTDLTVDPMFCDVANSDVRLNSASPLVADTASCGPIGALGVACGATPTLVQRFSAARVSSGVQIVWQMAAGATASAVWVERAESGTGGWMQPATERSHDNRAVVELDRSAMPDRAYWYRLVAQEGSTAEVIGAPIVVEASARLEFRLTEVGPNPGSGALRIGFALPRASEIEVAVFDVQGRRVATPAHGSWPAGAHAVEWSGCASGGENAPPGIYMLRYQYPGGQDKRAIVRVR